MKWNYVIFTIIIDREITKEMKMETRTIRLNEYYNESSIFNKCFKFVSSIRDIFTILSLYKYP